MQEILKRLPVAQTYLKKYAVIICLIAVGILYAYLIQTAGKQAQLEPAQGALNEALKTSNRAKIDEKSVNKLRELEDQNIEVKALFDEARRNPFAE